MATLLKCNAVFLHVPKTGGTYLKVLFSKLNLTMFHIGRNHVDMKRLLNIYDHYPGTFLRRSMLLRKNMQSHINKCFKFCFVRHPFDWYESFWRFQQSQNWIIKKQFSRTRFGFKHDTWHPFDPLKSLGNENFNLFINNVTKHCPGYLTELFDSYTSSGNIDYIGKQETLLQDIKYILNRLNVEYNPEVLKSLDRINASDLPVPVWENSNKKAIYKLEQAIFEKYNYDFK